MAMTIEQYLKKIEDGELLDVMEEILSGVVPATGYAHGLVRRVNRMIDKGELCINPTQYRKVYLPTMAKSVQREMARRYTRVLKGQMTFKATKSPCEQLTLGLVVDHKQVEVEDARA